MTHTSGYRRILSKMGYYDYQNGLIFRHLHQDGAWDTHLGHCRSCILNAFDMFKPEIVTILGSGWLLDLPLAEIAERTGRVYLVDIVHPPDVITQVRKFKNVELVEADVTGGLISEVWEKVKKQSFLKKIRSASQISVPDFSPEFDPGMIISLNILTQLHVLPVEFLKKKSKIGEAELNSLKKTIQERHIDFLKKNKSVLISDFEEIYTDNEGNDHPVPTLLADVPDGSSKQEWIWDFDIRGSDFYNRKSLMKVVTVTYGL